MLLLSGTIALFASILYSSSIIAFIGLGLTFWGALLLFIKPTKYVKASFIYSTGLSSLKVIDRIITDLNYRGKAIYLPPKYVKTIKGGTVFIPSKHNMIKVKITRSIFNDFCNEVRTLSNICGSLGCPLCSSIAIALNRTTSKPVVIEKYELSGDGKTIEIDYRIIENKIRSCV